MIWIDKVMAKEPADMTPAEHSIWLQSTRHRAAREADKTLTQTTTTPHYLPMAVQLYRLGGLSSRGRQLFDDLIRARQN